MDMGGMSGDGGGSTPLNDSGVDFSNFTQAYNFQQEILNDTSFQVIGNQYGRYFWYGIIVVVGISTIFNLVHKVILKARLRAAAANRPRPAKPTNIFTKTVATITAIAREATYPHFSPARTVSWFRIPPLGIILLILTYFGFILGLEFINNDTLGAQHYTAFGVRAAWLAIAQVPLLVLLVAKNNLIGLLTGVSYERINVLHRWVGRGLLLLATIHFGTQSYGWNMYGLMKLEWATDTCPPTGIKAYALLLWLNLTSLAPLRRLSYEFFVIQHILAFFGFIIAIMYHLPSTALYSRIWIYIAVGLYLVERIFRTLVYAYHNVKPGRATLEALDGATRIRVQNQHINKWKPGSHVLLSVPRFGIFQSHPATIASIPSSSNGDLVFVLKTKGGFTKHLWKGAEGTASLFTENEKDRIEAPRKTHMALIDGPYGGANPDFAAFDTVLLISASTGVTFTISQLLDIAHRAANSQKLPVRRLDFLWIVGKSSWALWFSEELQTAFKQLEAAGIEVTINIYVSRDETLTDSSGGTRKESGTGRDDCIQTAEITLASNGRELDSQRNEKKPAGLKFDCSCVNTDSGLRSCAKFHSGRPGLYPLLTELAEQAQGEMAIAVCGPLSLCTTMRTTVAKLSDERAVHKGSGAQGICLHVESVWY